MREELEEERERHFWGVALRVLATSVVLLAVLAALSALTVVLGWSRNLLSCALGLIAGASISAAVAGSRRARELTSLVVGAITLPALAAHLAAVGAVGEAALGAYTARLVPFLVHAAGALLGGVFIAAVWRPRVPRAETPAEAPAEPAEPAVRSGRAEPARQPRTEGAIP